MRDVPSQLYQVEVAFDQGGRAAKKFAIVHTGSVLIDRNGKIVYLDTLSNNTRELVRALRNTGVW